MSDFFALRRQRGTPPAREPFLRIWVEARCLANTPCVLQWREAPAVRHTAIIRETVEVSGIWMLCWLEMAAAATSHRALVQSLLPAFERGREDAPPCFVPVFDAQAMPSETRAVMQRLRTEYPDLLLPALVRDPSTGRREMPAAHPLRSDKCH